ncbi:SRPBCC family protein [Paractinoplanes maris]|uniref:SRPBCC family protein n=1 Tax=Paractinoplanes maris TaxID=1734446 RepID=UPI00201FC5C6|nr:SRPBCC family protein [Actinoplanes maris]
MTLRRSLEVVGPRPADDVWDRYARPERWPEWSPQIRAVDYPEAVLRAGVSGTVRGPLGFPVRFRVLTVTPPRAWSWVVSAAGVRLTLWHTVEATERGTRTLLAIEGFAPAVLLYLPAARIALGKLVSG